MKHIIIVSFITLYLIMLTFAIITTFYLILIVIVLPFNVKLMNQYLIILTFIANF